MNDLQSALAQPIADFLHYQQALNKNYQTETLALQLFDHYLFEQGITGWQAITSSVIAAFMASRSRHPAKLQAFAGCVTALLRLGRIAALDKSKSSRATIKTRDGQTPALSVRFNDGQTFTGGGQWLTRHTEGSTACFRVRNRVCLTVRLGFTSRLSRAA